MGDDDADISEIMEGRLFLGSKGPAADLAALQARGVTHVVNCTADGIEGSVPNFFEGSGEMRYYRLALLDGPKCALLPVLQDVLDWTRTAFDGGGVVFAHCHAGSSRSGALVCAILMASERLTFADAWALARAKRPVVKPNAGFRAHLRAYQDTLDGVPAAANPSDSELAIDAQEFADAEMMARMQRYEWDEWSGYEEYKRAFEVALQRGETDWQQVEERLQDIEEGEPPPVLSVDPDAELGRTSSFRLHGESIDEYEQRLSLLAAAHEDGDGDSTADAATLLASLPTPPGGEAASVTLPPVQVEEDELLARLEWLKQLHAEDGVPLNHTRASIGEDEDSEELERRFARLQQMQYGEQRSVPGPEFEPEPDFELEPEPEPVD
jgi:protein tyrosine phosphatase (PTP) superfamily phosphohydrolase (DUF442 family)